MPPSSLVVFVQKNSETHRASTISENMKSNTEKTLDELKDDEM